MSKSEPFQAPWNFLGLEPERSSPASRAWVLPVPYESTTTYGKGTAGGPAAIIAASREVELYDRELGSEPATEFGACTLPPLAVTLHSPEEMVAFIESAVGGTLSGSPSPEVLAILGGEHGISPGAVRGLALALGRQSADLVAVQLDAHADLRDEYEGTRASHACTARRILETCPVFQIGVRNISAEGEEFRLGSSRLKTVFAEEAVAEAPAFLDELASFVRGKIVYLTIDVDALDPSIMPSTGTPEPGGLSWARVLDVVRTVCREAARVPAFDVVELAPSPSLSAPDFLAAKLVYKIMSLVLMKRPAG